jgi:hypothetical protein
MNLKQPVLGIAATVIVMAVSLGLVSLFEFPTFAGWVSYVLLCLIPMQIVVAVVWAGKHPRFATSKPQPLQGLLLVLVTLAVGAIAGAVYFVTAGGGISPPTPMLAHCTIVSVVVTFWAAIMFGGWPFTLIRNPVAVGLVLVAACYLVNYLLFLVLFDYAFMADAPVYVAGLDPGGLFNAWSALVFYVTALGAMFLVLHFDLWPLTKVGGLMKQPVLGLVWTAMAVGVAALAYYVGVTVRRVDPVQFLVAVPIPFIFGTIVELNMLQGSFFAKLGQPMKGVLSTLTAAVVGVALARMYGALAPMLTGVLAAGPPAYESEIWLASALLSVTFPFLVYFAEFFKMWPLQTAR